MTIILKLLLEWLEPQLESENEEGIKLYSNAIITPSFVETNGDVKLNYEPITS